MAKQEKSVSNSEISAYRGHIVSPKNSQEMIDIKDGCLQVDSSGKIHKVLPWQECESDSNQFKAVINFGDKLLLPGFVDMHLHLPQVAQTGRSGEHLLKWLEKYIFPAEAQFKDSDHAKTIAHWFFDELLRNGTTTACVFTTIHKEATDAAFEVAKQKGNRVIMGKVLMDTNSPPDLTEDVDQAIDDSLSLLDKWHLKENGRLMYAFIPRFAVTSTSKLLNACGEAWQKNKGSYMHTHLAESVGEVEYVKELFPKSRTYVDVYKDHGLFGKNTIFAHSIHLDDQDIENLKDHSCSLAHCPSSNFFLKSGVFSYNRVKQANVLFGLGSDVAAGPQMSMFGVMKDANYVQPKDWLEPKELFYRATLGGAQALDLADQIGSLEPGKEADFIVVDPTNRNAIARDMLESETEDILSSLVFLGDDRSVDATYVRGKQVFSRNS